jgi:hypothetical protein
MSSNLITRGFLERPCSSFSNVTGRKGPPQRVEIVTPAGFEIDKPDGTRYTLAGNRTQSTRASNGTTATGDP